MFFEIVEEVEVEEFFKRGFPPAVTVLNSIWKTLPL